MHTDIKYDLTDNEKAEGKAISDIIDWIGQTKYDKLTAEFKLMKRDGMSLENFRMWASLAGIQGYPVTVWYDKL